MHVFWVIHTQYNLMYLCVSLCLYIHDTYIIHTQYMRDCIRYIHVCIRYIQKIYACICMYFWVIHTQYNLMYLRVSLYLYLHDTYIIHTQYMRACIRYIHVCIIYIQDVYACICILIHTNTLCLYRYVFVCISDPDTYRPETIHANTSTCFIPSAGTGKACASRHIGLRRASCCLSWAIAAHHGFEVYRRIILHTRLAISCGVSAHALADC